MKDEKESRKGQVRRNARGWFGWAGALLLLSIGWGLGPGNGAWDESVGEHLGCKTGAPGKPQKGPGSVLAKGAAPSVFIENRGQWEGDFRYRARKGSATLFLGRKGWTLSLLERPVAVGVPGPFSRSRKRQRPEGESKGVALRFRFLETEGPGTLQGMAKQPGYYNFFLGNDPARWKSGLPGYGMVQGSGLYPGVDFRMKEGKGGFEYDLVLAPGADLGQVVLQVEGAQGMRLGEDGALVLDTALGPVRQPPPVAWEEGREGEARRIQVRYVLLGKDKFGFQAGDWQGLGRLWIDPDLQFSTFLGGDPTNFFFPLVRNARGEWVCGGFTVSPKFPTTPGVYSTKSKGKAEALVTCLDATGSRLVFSTFFGGKYDDVISELLTCLPELGKGP